ncbi:uncharacterized protein LOC118206295 isoform X1 [Anguilla anguilla]|uniref:uncharacterized protein LOC118206295 isoform X1 n=1 Tax=Anguilla anguilla TaxID=7936 RepID=UPI0015AF2343|nr:uncharacterized protein LOC118206295 isoform X1 [Anguilla anguilla]
MAKTDIFPPSLGCHFDTLPEPGVASAGPCLVGMDPVLRVQQWVVDSVPTDQLVYRFSVPDCGQIFMKERALLDHQGEHLDRDYLSMIQISNVMSLVTTQDKVLPMTEEAATSAGKWREPEGGSPSSGSQGKDLAPCNEAQGTSKLIWRNIDKLTDKLSWRSWVQRCLQNRTRARQKWPNTDAFTDDGSLGQLVNDEPRPNSEMKKMAVDGSPHLCVFAIKNIQKGEEIVFNHIGVDLPWRTSTKSEKTHTLQDRPELIVNESKKTHMLQDGPEIILNVSEKAHTLQDGLEISVNESKKMHTLQDATEMIVNETAES